MQFISARLAGAALPEVVLPEAPPPDPAHAGEERPQPDPVKAAELMDAAVPQTLAAPQPLWLVECGNFSHAGLPCPDLRALTHLKALGLAGGVAAVPGSAELQLEAQHAATLLKDSPVPVVSCNLRIKLEDARVQPFVKLAPGWFLTGVTSWKPAPAGPPANRWWELDDPVSSVRAVLRKLPRGARVVVVATHQPDTVLTALADMPLALIVGGNVRTAPQQAPMLPAPPGKAQLLDLVSLSPGKTGAAGRTALQITPWQVALSDVWPDDTQVTALFKEEYKLVRARLLGIRAESGGTQGWRKIEWGQSAKYLPQAPGQPTGPSAPTAPPALSYAGPDSCKACHPEAYATWQASVHSQAVAALKTPEDRENLDCLKCHSTGLLQPGGYDPFNPQPDRAWVSCENCHGPGSDHIALMSGKQGPPGAQGLGIARGALADCASCHDKYNSPAFDAQAYWAKIKH
jgi:hypothetical protein